MTKKYNQERHYKLLKYSKSLNKKGKKISKESYKSYRELLSYSAMVYSQLNWEIKDQYLEIFKDFFENNLTSFEFCELLEEKLELSEELSNTLLHSDNIHEKACDFTDFLDDLSIACEVCDRNPDLLRLPGHIGETEFRKEVEETFFELQKLLKE